jgi:hypothetical protein
MTTRDKLDHLFRLWDMLRRASFMEKAMHAEQAIGVSIEVLRDIERRLTSLERANGVREHDGR